MSKKKTHIPSNEYATMVLTLTKIEAHAASIDTSLKTIADWVEGVRSAAKWLKFLVIAIGAIVKFANIPPELKEKVLYVAETFLGFFF